MNYPTPEARAFFNRELGFHATGKEQDWELEFSDPHRVGEFIQNLETNEGHYRDDHKIALMALILASLEELAHLRQVPSSTWAKVSAILKRSNIYSALIRDWVPDIAEQNDFMISPTLRTMVLSGATGD